MDWTDDGIVLSARPHGEGSLVVSLLTIDHGRHAGLVRGGGSGRQRGMFQPGNLVRAGWRARPSPMARWRSASRIRRSMKVCWR